MMTSQGNGEGAALGAWALMPGLLLMLVGAAGAGLIRGLIAAWPSQQERVVQLAGLAAIIIVVLPVGIYLGVRRAPRLPAAPG